MKVKLATIGAWILALAVVLAFGQAAFYNFITFDDGAYVFLNPDVLRGLSKKGAISAFTQEVAGNWHPLTMLVYMTVSRAIGPYPWAYHLLNIAIHGANSVLLFKLLQEFLARSRTGFTSHAIQGAEKSLDRLDIAACGIAAALFALHPLRVESVVWVSELKDLLCGLFGLLSIRAYLDWTEEKTVKGYLLFTGYFVAGLMSKPMLVTLPFVLLLLDCWPLRRTSSLANYRGWVALIKEKIPLFALSTAACFLTFRYQQMGDAVRSLESFPFSLRLQTAFIGCATYLGKMIWPVDLALFYPYPKSWPAGTVIGALSLIVFLTVGALVAGRRHPALFTGWFWFLGTLAPVIGLVQVGQQALADRYTYIPSMGFSLFVAAATAALFKSRHFARPVRLGAATVAFAAITTLGVLTWKQTALWKTSETIYQHTLHVTGENWYMRQILAALLTQAGRIDEAQEHLHQALRMEPANASLWDDLGYVLQFKGRIPESIEALKKAIELDSRRSGAHRLLASLLRQKGDSVAAAEHLELAVRSSPKDSRSLIDLARLRASHPDPALRNGEQAVALASRACELSEFGDPSALDGLAAAYAEDRQFDRAATLARRAIAVASAHRMSKLAAEIERRLSLYEMQIPYREER